MISIEETEWRPAPDWEGLYEVSADGRVRRVGAKEIYIYRRKGKYCSVHLSNNGHAKTVSLHILVAKAFCPRPTGTGEVNHKNGNKHDNAADNLEWTTRSGNNAHAYRALGRAPVKSCVGRTGSKHPLAKRVMGIEVETGRKEEYESSYMTKQLGFCPSAVTRCARGEQPAHKGWRWNYV